jgi:hypothetical protein
MARKSTEAKLIRLLPEYPQPPADLCEQAQGLWRQIVHSWPPKHFKAGSLSLLRTFVEISVMLERLGPKMLDGDEVAFEKAAKLATIQSTLATKLRLSIQSALRIENARIMAKQSAYFGDPQELRERAHPPRPWDPD